MPIYEYQCQSCQHQLEAIQKISDKPLQDCPSCGAAQLKKKVSAAAFRLKGGGWYETDFKTGDKKNIAGDKGSAPAAAAGSSDNATGSSSSAKSGSTGSKSSATS
ncbi:MAG: zinc ribbon domain-containing protein [Halieaceae bacterium]